MKSLDRPRFFISVAARSCLAQ